MPRSSEASPIFESAPGDARIMKPLGDLVALYHRQSGATHLLAEPLPDILRALDEGACDVTTLHARLAERFDLGDDAAAAHSALVARMDELEALGLVRRLPAER